MANDVRMMAVCRRSEAIARYQRIKSLGRTLQPPPRYAVLPSLLGALADVMAHLIVFAGSGLTCCLDVVVVVRA